MEDQRKFVRSCIDDERRLIEQEKPLFANLHSVISRRKGSNREAPSSIGLSLVGLTAAIFKFALSGCDGGTILIPHHAG
jgi:hypothetical protein